MIDAEGEMTYWRAFETSNPGCKSNTAIIQGCVSALTKFMTSWDRAAKQMKP
jgi:hypothetical protein